MNKVYKDGDKVKVLTSQFTPCKKGDILIAKDDHTYEHDNCGYYLGGGFIDTAWLNERNHGRFEEYEEFDMKNSTWFIRVNNAEQLKAVAEWLEPQGIKSQFGTGFIPGTNCICKDRTDTNYFFRAVLDEDVLKNIQEVVVNFETVTQVSSVVYPKSEKQKRIEQLEQQIAEANKELEDLKNG